MLVRFFNLFPWRRFQDGWLAKMPNSTVADPCQACRDAHRGSFGTLQTGPKTSVARKHWVQETAIRGIGYLGLIGWAALTVVLAGCGEKEKKPTRPPPPPPVADTAPPPGPSTAPGSNQPPDQAAAQPTVPEKHKRPEKVEDWKREDYFSARAEGDPKLVEALQYFGQKFVGNASAALMLEELIRVETPPAPKPEEKPGTPPGPGQPGQHGQPGQPPGAAPPGQIPPEAPGMFPGAPPGTMGPGGQARPIQLTQQALEMAVWALVLNNTKEAREIIGKILAGKLDSGMDRVATETALKTLAAIPIPENEAILLTVLTTPEQLRPPASKEKPAGMPGIPGGVPGPARPGLEMPPGGPGYAPGMGEQVTAAWLQQTTLDLVKNHASAALRENLAKYLVNPNVPLDVVERLGAFLKEPHPLNLRAQLLFLQAPDTTEEVRKKLFEYFMKYSSDCTAWVLGVPTGAVSGRPGMGTGISPGFGMETPGAMSFPGGTPGMPSWPGQGALGPSGPAGYRPPDQAGKSAQPDPDLPYRIAATIWGPEIHAFLETALSQVASLEEHSPLVLWATMVPTHSMRHRVYEILKARWYDSPSGLQKAGFPNQWVCDPGVVVCLKQLPRARTWKTDTGSGIGTPGTRTPGSTPAGKSLSPVMREKQQREQTEEEWLRISSDLVLAFCQRFQQAGLQEIEIARQQRRRPDFTIPIQDLPIPLHEPQLIPKPSYRLLLPGEVGKKIPGVALAPTLIHYVRLEHKEKPSKVLEHYKRQLKTRRIYEFGQMVWLDALQSGRSEELLRSIDVVMTRGQTGTGLPGGMPGAAPSRGSGTREKETEEPLVIQILVIEMRDPSQDPSQAPSAARVSEEKP